MPTAVGGLEACMVQDGSPGAKEVEDLDWIWQPGSENTVRPWLHHHPNSKEGKKPVSFSDVLC